MLVKRSIPFVLAAAVVCAAAFAAAGRAAEGTPAAIAAFNTSFASINDYTATLRAHEVLGDKTQDRVYSYWFMKPHFAKTLIVSGDGQGSGGVWSGGDTVSGHQGGILSGLHLTVSIHDPRATSLRGFTIPDGLIQNIVAKMTSVKGTLTQAPGGKLGGVPTDRVELKVADPSTNDGISDQVIYFSQQTHWPIRELLYAGSQIVLDQSVSDLKTNVGLTDKDF